MFIQPYNELRFSIVIESTSPLLVKEGRLTDDRRQEWFTPEERREVPNAIPISFASLSEIREALKRKAIDRLPYYLPGSTLRGVSRSHLERTLRGLNSPDDPRLCDPFDDSVASQSVSCSTILTARRSESEGESFREFHPYAESCPVCRMFGSTLQASRISFTDGMPQGSLQGKLVQREHVRISRRTGSVAPGALIRFCGLDKARFEFTMILRNFELSQVMLIGALLTDMKHGNVTIGSGRSKGYGRVKFVSADIVLTQFGLQPQEPAELRGVAEHPDKNIRGWFQSRYGLRPCPTTPQLPAGEWRHPLPWRHEREIPTDYFFETWPKLSLEWSAVQPLSARGGR